MQSNDESRLLDRRSFLARAAAAAAALALVRTTDVAYAAPAPEPTLVDENMELAVHVDLLAPSVGRYPRPYVAVWIEDEAGFPVRTLALWMNARASRYVLELRRWYHDEQSRYSKEGGDFIPVVSSPTRRPGSYTLTWDGRNDLGEAVPFGDYYICVESAREHGPYSLVREPITLQDAAFQASFDGTREIGGVRVEYRDGSAV